MRNFWLVQRLDYRPNQPASPFGYGTIGGYHLDYMGAAEFEWGAIPEAYERLANGNPTITRHEYNGQQIDFAYLSDDPFDNWCKWYDGDMRGKVTPYELGRRLSGTASEFDDTAIWWSLEDDVLWSIVKPDGTSHVRKMLELVPE